MLFIDKVALIEQRYEELNNLMADPAVATNCPAADQYIRRSYREGWDFT